MCFLTVFTVFPNTALFISLKKSFSNHFWLLLSVPCSYLCTASAMLLDWTRLSCALFLALVHHPMPDSELLYVLHSFSCHRDYTQVSLTYQKSFFRVRTADCCVTLVQQIVNLGYSTSSSSMYPLSPCHCLYHSPL